MSGVPVEVRDLVAVYEADGERVAALDRVDLDVAAGELVAVLGPSGSGKSTLLAILAGLQRPTSGTVRIGDREVSSLTARQLLALRRDLVAVVVQDARRNLIPYGTAVENVRFAQGARRRGDRLDPLTLLRDLGLGAVAGASVDRLSGGERQRVAIATGLATRPGLLLVDEPTSALDARTREGVVDLLIEANRQTGTTVVVITHDPEVAARAHRSIRLRDGRIAGAA